jgi:tetraacyldisaccharide 4'-kinase
MRQEGARLAVPVVCVGNPTVGGAGKTPVALALAEALAARGRSPVFLTRGYRGRLAGPVIVAGHDAAAVGDEALLLAAERPTVVSRDRAAGGRLAATLGDVVVMDDGFQNPALEKDVALLVIDRAVGLGNGRVTPAGPLRAPLAAQLPICDAVVVVDAGEAVAAPLPALGVPVHAVRLIPSAPVPLAGREVFAFAGIGRPEKFFASLEALGAIVAARRSFGDHEPISERDARLILRQAGARLPVTTAKDRVRLLAGGPEAQRLAEAATVVTVRAALPEALVNLVAAGVVRAGRS